MIFAKTVERIVGQVQQYITTIFNNPKWLHTKMLIDFHMMNMEEDVYTGFLESEYYSHDNCPVMIIKEAKVINLPDNFKLVIIMEGLDNDTVGVYIQSDLPIETDPHYDIKSCPSTMYLLEELTKLFKESYPSEF